MKRRINDRLFNEIMGYTNPPIEVVAQPPASHSITMLPPITEEKKLHLNIGNLLNYFSEGIKRLGQVIGRKSQEANTGKAGEKQTLSPKSTTRSDLVGLAKFVVGYGIITGLVLSLFIMLVPLQVTPLSEALRGNLWLQIVVLILGSGCLVYLFYDWNLFSASLRNRGKV